MRMDEVATALAVLGSLAATGALAAETGFLNRSVRTGGVEYRYQVFVPREFRSSARWPVVLALHGGGDHGSDGVRQTVGGLAAAIRQHAERFPAIVVLPQCPADGRPSWQGRCGDAALAALDRALTEFSGDPRRVSLTGYSAGGNGSWYLASRHPERFAAVVVVCGWISEFHGHTSGLTYPALAPTAADPYAAVAKSVAGLPIWIFHGGADPTVSPEESRKMAKALAALGADVQYTELPGVGHDAWDAVYEREDVAAWLLGHRRPR